MSRSARFHKIVRNPTPENTLVITRRTLNESYAVMLAESGKIFVSDLERRQAWRTAKRLSELLKVQVRQSLAVHIADGKEYSGYEFKIAGELKCPHCKSVIFNFSA